MSLKPQHVSGKTVRLADLIEVEVVSLEGARSDGSLSSASPRETMSACIEDLVECLEQLDGTESASKVASSADPQKTALEAVSDMENHIRRFQKQSAVLRRLITKLH